MFCAVFLQLQFGFVIFRFKSVGSNAAHKMLVKLTTGVNLGRTLSPRYSRALAHQPRPDEVPSSTRGRS